MFVWIVLVRKEKKLELKYNNNKKNKKIVPEQFSQDPFHQQECHSNDCCIVKPTTLVHSSDTWRSKHQLKKFQTGEQQHKV
jgi:hypothetical protein